MISASHGLLIFRKLVRANAGIMAMLTGGIHINRTPQPNQLPYATISIVATQPNDSKDGVSAVDDNQVQLDIYTQDRSAGDALSGYETAAIIEAAIRDLLDGHQGPVTVSDSLDVWIDEIKWRTQNPAPFEDERDVHRISVDYLVRLKRLEL